MFGEDWGEWKQGWVVVSSRTGGGRRGKGCVVVAVYMREEGSGGNGCCSYEFGNLQRMFI